MLPRSSVNLLVLWPWHVSQDQRQKRAVPKQPDEDASVMTVLFVALASAAT